MLSTRKLWYSLALVFILSFGVLLYLGWTIYKESPPVPESVVSEDGKVLFTIEDIQHGREIWQKTGGQQFGSVWGHGAYVAPDWTADWLHREALELLDIWAMKEFRSSYADLDAELQAALNQRLKIELKKNTFDPQTKQVTVSSDRALAMKKVVQHYNDLYGDTAALNPTRVKYAMPDGLIDNEGDREAISSFFFWTAWAAVTNRPGSDSTYTNNWPGDKLIGNTPSTEIGVWSIASIIILIAGIAALAGWHAMQKHENHTLPIRDPFAGGKVTPSMLATKKYFFVAMALFLTQICLGIITAHYAVEGHYFYGIKIVDIIPYAVTRTWHTQLAVLWIATTWLATGLYMSVALSGYEPKYQKLGVDLLFYALLVIVVGSFAGEWLAVQGFMPTSINFWFGHQGYEYVDLGRFWQILLFVGLIFWVFLVSRALLPLIKKSTEDRNIILMVLLSAGAIGLFYGAGLAWGKHTSLAVVEYWRWWVVHLWVEGFFEVFATSIIALLFVKLGLVRASTANSSVVFSAAIFLTGGILGTLHHLYFTGSNMMIIAVGASFSALEVVPLVFLGYEAFESYRLVQNKNWIENYRMPILFFISVAFWNLVGAGFLGFTINPPISLYYIQGLNLTPAHGHAALFGVYGMLGIGLMLFCLKGLNLKHWNNKLLTWALILLNIGLFAMVFGSLVPAGLYQAIASVKHGMWYARSPEVVHSHLMELFVWLRVPGDTIFAIGALCVILFFISLRKNSA